jgi:putative ABC transport system substrate-binding protein
MRRSLVIGLTSASVLLVAACGSSKSASTAATKSSTPASAAAPASGSTYKGKKVCVDQYASSSATADIVAGVRSALAKATAAGLRIDVQNPQADAGTEATIAQEFISSGCDVLVPAGTPAAELYANTTKKVPIVFAGVATPVAAHLVASLAHPGGNVTGVSAPTPVVAEVNALHEVLPQAKAVGLIWTLGDAAGDPNAAEAQARLKQLGVKYVNATINGTADITQAVQSLSGKVQAIYLPGGSAVTAAAPALLKAAEAAKLPVFGGTDVAVTAGAILADGYDYTLTGRLTGALVLKVLDGAAPATTAVVVTPATKFSFNAAAAKTLGVTIPSALLAESAAS